MPEVIDLLTTKIDEGAQFTVDTTGPLSVDLVQVAPGMSQIMYAGGGGHIFRRGDVFTILSAGFFVPESFILYGYDVGGVDYAVPILQLFGAGAGGGGDIYVRNFGNNGQFRIPFQNYEFSAGTTQDPEMNNFVDPLGFDLKAYFPFTAGLQYPQISMVNVPVALNGIVFNVVPFIKVLHNFQLTV